jgi:surfactin synthase thioesterase subunit
MGLVVGAVPAPHLALVGPPIHALPEKAFLEAIHERYGTPWDILRNADLMSLSLPSLRADLQAHETYAYAPDTLLPLSILALRGAHDTRVTRANVEAWAAVTAADITVCEINAGHLFVDTHRDWVVGHVAERLRAS